MSKPNAELHDAGLINENGSFDAKPELPSTAVGGPTTLAKLRGLPWSIAGNSLNAIFAQFAFFGSVFVLFLDALGLSNSDSVGQG